MSPRLPGKALRSRVVRLPFVSRARESVGDLRLAWGVVVARSEAWPGMHQPFNGQLVRLRAVRTLIDDFEPDAFIETGTFIGSTTRFFCGNGVPVFTVEVKRLFWLLGRLRLGWNRDVTVLKSDSRAALQQLAAQEAFVRPFIYLDAHWRHDLPLNDELRLTFGAWDDAVVIVDDFRVDDDPGYAFDIYDGKALALAEIDVPEKVMLAAPAQSASEETGARRGTLYAAKGPRAEHAVEEAVRRGLLRLM
jgi:hypothetical protein